MFAKSCVCDRNRRQPSATVRNRLRWRRKALHKGERVWSGPESVSSWLLLAAVILAFAEEVSVRVICVAAVILAFAEERRRCDVGVRDLCRRNYFGVCRGIVYESDLCRRSHICVCRGGVGVRDLCRRSQIGVCRGCVCVRVIYIAAFILAFAEERCRYEGSVSPQLYWRLQRSCLWEWSVSPQLYLRLQRGRRCEGSVSPQLNWCLQRRRVK